MAQGAAHAMRTKKAIRGCADPQEQAVQEMKATGPAVCGLSEGARSQAATHGREYPQPCAFCPDCSRMEVSRRWQEGAAGLKVEVRQHYAVVRIAEQCLHR